MMMVSLCLQTQRKSSSSGAMVLLCPGLSRLGALKVSLPLFVICRTQIRPWTWHGRMNPSGRAEGRGPSTHLRSWVKAQKKNKFQQEGREGRMKEGKKEKEREKKTQKGPKKEMKKDRALPWSSQSRKRGPSWLLQQIGMNFLAINSAGSWPHCLSLYKIQYFPFCYSWHNDKKGRNKSSPFLMKLLGILSLSELTWPLPFWFRGWHKSHIATWTSPWQPPPRFTQRQSWQFNIQ